MNNVLITLYRGISTPAQKLFGPNLTHKAGELVMHSPLWRLARRFGNLPVGAGATVCGTALPSPLVAAAGIDKNCRFVGQLLDIGFGGVVGGTITTQARAGNPKPRLLLERGSATIINALGFPNRGVQKAVKRLAKLGDRKQRVFVSISGDTPDQFGDCYRACAPHAAAVEINISSPNTPALKSLNNPQGVRDILTALQPLTVPVMLKLPRPNDNASLKTVMDLAATALENGCGGLVACNTLPVSDSRLAVGKGGLSGATLFDSTLKTVRALKKEFPAGEVVGCGGVSTAEQVVRLLDAGAAAAQLYTALVYAGPALPRHINSQLQRLLDEGLLKRLNN